HENHVQDLDAFGRLGPELLNGVVDGGAVADLDEPVVHQAARGVFRPLGQLFDVEGDLRIVGAEPPHELLDGFFRQETEEVDGVVDIHAGYQLRGGVDAELPGESYLTVFFEPFEDLRTELEREHPQGAG